MVLISKNLFTELEFGILILKLAKTKQNGHHLNIFYPITRLLSFIESFTYVFDTKDSKCCQLGLSSIYLEFQDGRHNITYINYGYIKLYYEHN